MGRDWNLDNTSGYSSAELHDLNNELHDYLVERDLTGPDADERDVERAKKAFADMVAQR